MKTDTYGITIIKNIINLHGYSKGFEEGEAKLSSLADDFLMMLNQAVEEKNIILKAFPIIRTNEYSIKENVIPEQNIFYITSLSNLTMYLKTLNESEKNIIIDFLSKVDIILIGEKKYKEGGL